MITQVRRRPHRSCSPRMFDREQGRSRQCGRACWRARGEDVVMQPLLGCFEPRLEPVTMPTLWLDQHNPRGLNEQNAEVTIAALRYLAEDGAVGGGDLPGD